MAESIHSVVAGAVLGTGKNGRDHIFMDNKPRSHHTFLISNTLDSGGRMPYPVGHRARVNARIIQSARRLFNRHGFDNVSVQQIMLGAGLTHGGFYSYFKSKSDLYAKVLGYSST